MFSAGAEKTYMQYLVFYECLEEHYYKAFKLFKHAMKEIDEKEYGLDEIEGLEELSEDTKDDETYLGSYTGETKDSTMQ